MALHVLASAGVGQDVPVVIVRNKVDKLVGHADLSPYSDEELRRQVRASPGLVVSHTGPWEMVRCLP